MAFVPIPDVARVELVFLQQGQYVENVYHVYDPAGWSTATLQTLGLDAKNSWVTNLKSLHHTGVSLQKILCRDMTTDTAPGIEFATGLPIAGTATGTENAMNVTVAIKWLTGLRGRSYRGRTYHIGMAKESISGSTVVGGSLALLLAGYTAWKSFPLGTNQKMVVVSTRHNNALRNPGIWTEVSACSIDPTTDSQRRRLPGRGR